MKLSELTTDQALDALCELTPHVANIVSDEAVLAAAGTMIDDSKPLNMVGKAMLVADRLTELVPLLLKAHRGDVYGILAVMNARPVKEIAAQKLTDTMRQVQELIHDEDFLSFFKLSARQGQTVPSAPSAPSLASE